jgi:hypothetical protein
MTDDSPDPLALLEESIANSDEELESDEDDHRNGGDGNMPRGSEQPAGEFEQERRRRAAVSPEFEPTPQPDKDKFGDALVAVLQSQATLTKLLIQQKSRRHKVHVKMPDKFDGKIGDYIDTWLEQFETWFRHVANFEREVDDRMKVETAVQQTESQISIELTHQQEDYGKWETWESFCEYMKKTYGSMDTGYMKWLRLRQLTQSSTETVDSYYSRFRRRMSTQVKRMRDSGDNFIFNFMFLDGLKKEVNAEVLHLSEARTVEQLTLQDTLELAKRAEQSAKMRSGTHNITSSSAGQQSHAGPIRHKNGNGKNGKHGKSDSHGERSVGLTDGEKKFLKSNCERGGGLVIRKDTRMKSEWQGMARKEGRCIICAAKGHTFMQCTAEKDAARRKQLNTMESRSVHTPIEQDDAYDETHDVDRLCTLSQQKNTLMVYQCQVNRRNGRAMTDTGATRVFISKKYALATNVKWLQKDKFHNVKLPNGDTIKVLGNCEFELQLSEWSGPVQATIIDIDADFDIVLGLDWFKQVRPVPDWTTLDWFVPVEGGTLRIEHLSYSGKDARPKLITLADDFEDVELRFSHISWSEAEKLLRKGGQGVLHWAKSSDQNLHPDIPRLNSLEDGLDGLNKVNPPRMSKVDNQEFVAAQDTSMQGLIRDNIDVFREELPEGPPPSRAIEHSIDTGSERPVNRNAYPLSAVLLREQAKQIEDLLKRGLIQESSSA